MTFQLSLNAILTCLEELDSELLRLTDGECSQAPTSQLCAFFLLGVRAVWLMKGMANSIQSSDPDAYYVLGRASWEACQLQLEFRLKESQTRATMWFQKEADSWKANHAMLDRWIKGLKGPASTFGRQYGDLSELAHPTFQGTQNSTICALAGRNDPPSVAKVQTAVEDACLDLSGRVMREFWIIDAQHPELIDLPIEKAYLPNCEKAFEAFQQSLTPS